MPLRPGLPVGRSAFADALQVGNQGMRIRTGHSLCQVIGVGRVTVGVQVGKVRSVHGEAPCKAIGSRHAEVADGTWFESGLTSSRRARTPPRTARHSRQTDCQPAPRNVDAGWQAQSLKVNTGFETRPPVFGGTPSEPASLCNANQKSCK
ncbi:hypothetical protein D3C81_1601880 [compost metagenome]